MGLEATLEAGPAPLVAEPSFEQLYDAHVDGVWRTLARLGVEDMHIEDAVQEVFVTAWRRRADFGQRSRFATWLTGIALNVAAHQRRSRQRHGRPTQPLDEGLAETLAEPKGGPAEQAEAREGLAQLQRVLGQLSDEQRDVFVMMELEGFSAAEASALLGVGLNTVYSRLRLARAAFNLAVEQLRP